MDSSQYNPNYAQWNPPYSSHPPPSSQSPLLPPPPPFPPPPRQSHTESPNIYPRSIQNGNHHQEYHHHHYSHRQDLPPKPAVNQPSPSYYSQHPPQQQQQHPPPLSQQQQQQQHPQYVPQQVSYESRRLLQPSSSTISGLESQRVDFKDLFESWSPDSDTGRGRVDAGPGRSYQYDYSRSSRDASGIDVNGSSRSRDEFRSLGYVRTESGATRIEGNYQDRGQLKSESDRYFRGIDERKRGLSSSVGYASNRYGATVGRGRDMNRSSASHEGIRNQRRDEGHNGGRTLYPRKNDDYYRTDIEQYADRGRREESNESNQTPRKQVQKKSALLRLEAPRSHQNGRENDRSWQHSQYSGKRFKPNSFRGKEHLGQSDRGLVEKQRRRNPVDLDVSFESNVLVAKLSPTNADIHPGSSVTPRSSKARRALMADKNEKASVSEGNGKFRTHFSDEALVPEGSRQSTRQTTASEIEKKPGNHSTPSLSDTAGKLNRVRFVDGVVQDCKGKITDTGSEASTHDSEAKVRGTVHAEEKISSFCEVLKEAKDDTSVKHDSEMEAACTKEVCGTVHAAENISSFCDVLKEAKDDTNVKHDSNMEASCSTEEDVIDGDKTTLKSDEDVLNRLGTDCNAGEAILLKVTEKEDIMKTKTNVNTSPIKLPVSWPTAADLSGCSEAGIHLAAKSICSVGSQLSEDGDIDCIPSRNLPMMEVSTGFEERKSTESSIESLGYGKRDFEMSSLEASINFNSEDHVDQVLVKSDSGVIEDDNKESSKNVDSLSPENDSCRDPPNGLVSSAALDVTSVSMELSNANNNVSGDFANANNSVSGDLANIKCFTSGIFANTMVKAPDMSVAFQVESKNLPHCERNTVNSSVENVSRKESMKTTPLSSAAEMADNLDKDEGKQTYVDGLSSSCTKVAVNGSSKVLPVERTEDCSRNDESDLAMAVPSEVYMENVSTEKLKPDQDLVLASHHPAEIPSLDQFSGSDRRGVKAALLEPNVSLSKNIHDGLSEFFVERDVGQIASTMCDNLPSSSASIIEMNLATGINGGACSRMVTGAESGLHESQPCLIVCKSLPEDRIGCESSGAIASVWDLSLDKDLEKDPSRVSSCIVSDNSISPCHISSLVAVNEQIQNKTSIQGNCSDFQGGIMRKEMNGVKNIDDDDFQKEITKPSGGTSEYRVPRTDIIAVKGDSRYSCDSLSSSPELSFRRIQSEIHIAGIADDTSKDKEKPKPSGGTFEYRAPGTDTVAISGDSVIPCDSVSSSPRLCKQIRSEIHVASRGDEYSKYKEKTKPSGGTSKYRPPETDIGAASRVSVFPCDSLSSSPKRNFRHIRSEIYVAAMADDTGKVKESHKEDTSQEKILTSHKVTQQSSSLAQYPCLGQTSPYTDVDSYDHPMSKYSGGNLVEKPNDDPVKKLADVTSDVGSRRVKADTFDGEALSSDGKVSGTDVSGDLGIRLSRAHTHADVKFALTHAKNHVVSVPDQDSQSKISLSSRCEIEKRKNKSNYSTQNSYSRSLPLVSDTKKASNPSTHTTKRHTWHRKSDTSAPPSVAAKPLLSTLSTQEKFPKATAQSSSSYVRKGNSLLRKPTHTSPGVSRRKPSHASPGVSPGMPPSVIQLNRQLICLTVEDTSTGAASKVDVDNTSFPVKTGETISRERQSKPPSDSSTSKVSNAIAASSGKCVSSYSMDHPITGLPESIMDSATSLEANVPNSGGDTFKTSDTFIQTGYASDCQQMGNLPKLDSSNLRRTVYVKRKANQLVAALDTHGASKSQIPPSDGYFKRSKNQLVRNSDSRLSQSVSLPDDALDSRAAANMVSERSSSSAYSDSAVMRPYKHSKFSLVWTQNGPQSRRPIGRMRYQRILPQLVPWKRVTYWRRLMNSVSALKNGSFSNISRKLSMMRKRHTVYTRSTNGYSLRKSKVLSIGGSHLKWSKSIERDSRKANEEATLAVAAISKKESENHFGQSNIRMTSGNHVARERVFRVGGLRYKMDSSRRTLQRISDVDPPCSGASENVKDVKRAFIPKRLVIGNEEYVRVGNGNQLVRDPKKRTRVLANEKVRWSLHNVRLRLAKKKKYCQFFTRFGKCNKDDGKCPYVHDPSKIAVCTKFLNGLCANTNCKLTHKVIPERMPDCSYFLQGLCNNEACPYRHVHVNPSAAICDGFLKGYCSDGDECRKKHSYTCPVFEATGSCSQGSKCKLHHPKNQSNGRKRKRLSEPSQKNARGRYFGSPHKVPSESEPVVRDRHSTESEVFGMEGLNFIFLGATEYESSDNIDSTTKQSSSGQSEEPVSIHNLIRPVALMQ